MDIFESDPLLSRHYVDGAFLSFDGTGRMSSLCLSHDEYTVKGQERPDRACYVELRYDGTRDGYRLAWSIARRLFRSHLGNPALLLAREMERVAISELAPRHAWVSVDKEQAYNPTPKAARRLPSAPLLSFQAAALLKLALLPEGELQRTFETSRHLHPEVAERADLLRPSAVSCHQGVETFRAATAVFLSSLSGMAGDVFSNAPKACVRAVAALLIMGVVTSCRSVSDSSSIHDASQTDSLGMVMKIQALNGLETLHAHLSARTPGDLVILLGLLVSALVVIEVVLPWLLARRCYQIGHWDGRLMQSQRNPMPRARRRDDVEFAAQHETGVDPV